MRSSSTTHTLAFQVPGEAFVSAARQNPVSKESAVFLFREAGLMLPRPMRKYLWEDFIFNRQPGGGGEEAEMAEERGGASRSRRSRDGRKEKRVKPKSVRRIVSLDSWKKVPVFPKH